MRDCRYNSAVYTSLSANDFFVTVVTSNHFEPGAYTNTTMIQNKGFGILLYSPLNSNGSLRYQPNSATPLSTNSSSIQQFINMLEGNNTSTESYKDLMLSECTKVYNTDFLTNHRNLFLITNHSSNTTFNNTLLDIAWISSNLPTPPNNWLCASESSLEFSTKCNPSHPSSNLKSGLPWRVMIGTGYGAEVEEEVEIAGCKSEITDEKCKVQFSLGIMIVVICCNLIKACCMIVMLIRSREPTMVTLGDAIDSFLRIPDSTTIGMCFADRSLIKGEWRGGWRAGPRQWKQKGVQRWWTSASKTRWITCNFFCTINIVLLLLLLVHGMRIDRKWGSTDFRSM